MYIYCPNNKKKITRYLKDMNVMFLRQEQLISHALVRANQA